MYPNCTKQIYGFTWKAISIPSMGLLIILCITQRQDQKPILGWVVNHESYFIEIHMRISSSSASHKDSSSQKLLVIYNLMMGSFESFKFWELPEICEVWKVGCFCLFVFYLFCCCVVLFFFSEFPVLLYGKKLFSLKGYSYTTDASLHYTNRYEFIYQL